MTRDRSIVRSLDRWIPSSGEINACSLLSFRRFNEQILGRILIAPDSARRQRANPSRHPIVYHFGIEESAVELETGENTFHGGALVPPKFLPPLKFDRLNFSRFRCPNFFDLHRRPAKILDNTCTWNFFSSSQMRGKSLWISFIGFHPVIFKSGPRSFHASYFW